MKIHVICSKEELEKTDEIQEALGRAMKPLTDLGFNGEISIVGETSKDLEDRYCKKAENARIGLRRRQRWGLDEETKEQLKDGIDFCEYIIAQKIKYPSKEVAEGIKNFILIPILEGKSIDAKALEKASRFFIFAPLFIRIH